jgi:hypothetical protein
MGQRSRRHFLKLSALAGASCFPSCSGVGFQAHDVVVSDVDDTLIDPEFTELGLHMAWVDRNHRLWVNDLHPDTGTWTPRNGRQLLVDTSLIRVGKTRQGLEWAAAHDGPRMVYTKERGSECSLNQAKRVEGRWVTEALEGGAGLWLYQTSKDQGDPKPRAIFRRERSPTRFGWRELDDPASQEWIPGIHRQLLWVRGARAAVGIDTEHRPFVYQIDSREFLRAPAWGSTRHASPSGFRNESGLTVVTVLDHTRIGIHQVTRGAWSLVRTLRPESDLPFVFHPKLWFHRGQPVLTFMMATETDGRVQNTRGDAEAWIATFTAGAPFLRRVNDLSIKRIKDTEGVSLPGGFFVYYAEILPDRRRLIHRCHSGL